MSLNGIEEFGLQKKNIFGLTKSKTSKLDFLNRSQFISLDDKRCSTNKRADTVDLLDKISNKVCSMAKDVDSLRTLHQQFPHYQFQHLYDNSKKQQAKPKVLIKQPSIKVLFAKPNYTNINIPNSLKRKNSLLMTEGETMSRIYQTELKSKNPTFHQKIYFNNFKKEEGKFMKKSESLFLALKTKFRKIGIQSLKVERDTSNFSVSKYSRVPKSNFFLTIPTETDFDFKRAYNTVQTDKEDSSFDFKSTISNGQLKAKFLSTKMNKTSRKSIEGSLKTCQDFLSTKKQTIPTFATLTTLSDTKVNFNLRKNIDTLIESGNEINANINMSSVKEDIFLNQQRLNSKEFQNDKVVILNSNKIDKFEKSVFIYGSISERGMFWNNRDVVRDSKIMKMMKSEKVYEQYNFLRHRFKMDQKKNISKKTEADICQETSHKKILGLLGKAENSRFKYLKSNHK